MLYCRENQQWYEDYIFRRKILHLDWAQAYSQYYGDKVDQTRYKERVEEYYDGTGALKAIGAALLLIIVSVVLVSLGFSGASKVERIAIAISASILAVSIEMVALRNYYSKAEKRLEKIGDRMSILESIWPGIEERVANNMKNGITIPGSPLKKAPNYDDIIEERDIPDKVDLTGVLDDTKDDPLKRQAEIEATVAAVGSLLAKNSKPKPRVKNRTEEEMQAAIEAAFKVDNEAEAKVEPATNDDIVFEEQTNTKDEPELMTKEQIEVKEEVNTEDEPEINDDITVEDETEVQDEPETTKETEEIPEVEEVVEDEPEDVAEAEVEVERPKEGADYASYNLSDFARLFNELAKRP